MSRVMQWVVRHGRWVVAACFVLGGVAAIFGIDVVSKMSGNVADPRSESAMATQQVAAASGVNPTIDDLLLTVKLPANADTAQGQQTIGEAARRLGEQADVVNVLAPLRRGTAPIPEGLVSAGGRTALLMAQIKADADNDATVHHVRDAFAGDDAVLVGGQAAVNAEFSDRIGADLGRAELFAFPLLLVLAIWVFRGLVAAIVPMLIGGLAVILTMAALRVVTTQTTLSQYVMNLVLGLGLGLAVDYSLFIISRYREEAARIGHGQQAAMLAGLRAGHAVAFSAGTVAVSMAALLLFPQEFLWSMGVGGILVTLIAAVVAVIGVPAMLAVLGSRIDAVTLPRWRRAREREAADLTGGPWFRWSRWVWRHAGWSMLAGLLVVGVLGWQAAQVKFADVGTDALPTSAAPRVVSETVAREFPAADGTALFVVVTSPQSASTEVASIAREAARSDLVLQPPRFVGDDTWLINGVLKGDPYSQEAADSVNQIRDIKTRIPVKVGGAAAAFVDMKQSIVDKLPLALGLIALIVLWVMFRLTHSVVLSVKTVILNIFNVAMTFGVLVWVFQYGHLEWLFRYQSTGRVDLMQPLLVAVIAFGLSTDYGVFLFSRIKEFHHAGLPDAQAVPLGVGRTGRIITSAALLLVVAVGAFSTSSVLFIKQLGVGAAVAVFLDATLVRGVLVPSAMRLMQRVNWWAPALGGWGLDTEPVDVAALSAAGEPPRERYLGRHAADVTTSSGAAAEVPVAAMADLVEPVAVEAFTPADVRTATSNHARPTAAEMASAAPVSADLPAEPTATAEPTLALRTTQRIDPHDAPRHQADDVMVLPRTSGPTSVHPYQGRHRRPSLPTLEPELVSPARD